MRKLINAILIALVLSAASWAGEVTREVSIIARQFDFLPHKIEVVKGVPVRLYLTSLDVPHGIHIAKFNIMSQKIEKGKVTVVDFVPNEAGRYVIHCSVFCGIKHGAMQGELVVTEPAGTSKMPSMPKMQKEDPEMQHHMHM